LCKANIRFDFIMALRGKFEKYLAFKMLIKVNYRLNHKKRRPLANGRLCFVIVVSRN